MKNEKRKMKEKSEKVKEKIIWLKGQKGKDDGGKGNGHEFCEKADAEAGVEVGCGERTGIVADIRFYDSLAEIVMGATKPAVEDARQRCLGIAAVGRSMTASVFSDEGKKTHPRCLP